MTNNKKVCNEALLGHDTNGKKLIRDIGMINRLWYSETEKANSEQGEVLEGENCAQNFAILDNLVSLGKLSVTKKEF